LDALDCSVAVIVIEVDFSCSAFSWLTAAQRESEDAAPHYRPSMGFALVYDDDMRGDET
jgi:hypothetical protein